MDLLELFNRRTVRGKFFILTITLTLLPMILFSVVFYNVAVDKLGRRVAEQSHDALLMGDQYIQRIFVDLKDLMNVILIDKSIQGILNGHEADDYEYLNNLRTIGYSMSSITQNKSYITSYMLYSVNYKPDMRFYGGSNTYLSPEDGEHIYAELLQKDSVVWWNNMSLDRLSADPTKMLVGRLMRNTSFNNEPIGFVMLEIEKSAFFEGITFLQSSRDYHFFVLDDRQEAVHALVADDAADDSSLAGKLGTLRTFDFGKEREAVVDGIRYVVSSEQIENLPWRFVYMIEASDFYADASVIRKVTVGAFLILFAAGSVLAYAFSQAVSRPLRRLVIAIKRNVAGDDELRQFDSRDEVGQIGTQFIHITRENKVLHKRMMEEAVRRKEAEIQALQAQINPHFLYNTLDSLNWLALSSNQFKISEIVSALGRFFRISISKGKQDIPVADELEHVMAYLNVQRFRYNDLFDIVLEAEEEVGHCLTPKLVLQPLVENAIYHGLKPKQGGTILISTRSEGPNVILQVTDDGVGIREQRLAALRRLLEGDLDSEAAADSPVYGIKNVHERLRLRFDHPYGLRIDSREGLYTTVTLIIPRIAGKEEKEVDTDD